MAAKSKKQINPFIQAGRNHFEALETKEIEVKEWLDDDGQPLIIYCTCPTLAEKSKIVKLAQGSDHSLMAHTLIAKAMTSDGDHMFTISDKHSLMNLVDPVVVTRIAMSMCADYTIEDMKKK